MKYGIISPYRMALCCIVVSHGVVLYFGISLLTDIVDFSLPIIKDKKILKNIISNINIIYKQVKKSEKGDDMDYLYKNINEEKTNKKIDIMNSILNV